MVVRFKVPAKRPVQIIPVLWSIDVIDHHFTDHAKVPKDSQSDVFQGELHQLSLARSSADAARRRELPSAII